MKSRPQTQGNHITAYNEFIKLLKENIPLKTRQLSFEQFIPSQNDLKDLLKSTIIWKKQLEQIIVPMLQKLASICMSQLMKQNTTIEQIQTFLVSNILRNIKSINLQLPKLPQPQTYLDCINQILKDSLQQILLLCSSQTPLKQIFFSKKMEETVRTFQQQPCEYDSFFKTTEICIDYYVNMDELNQQGRYFKGIRSLIHKIIQQTHILCQRQQKQETIYTIYKSFLALLILPNKQTTNGNSIDTFQEINQLFTNQAQNLHEQILQKMQSQGKLSFPNLNKTENNIYEHFQVYQLILGWIEDHQFIFKNPQKYIFSKINFESTSNRTLYGIQQTQKLIMIQNIKSAYQQVKKNLQVLQNEYKLFQKYIFHFQLSHQTTYLIKDRNIRSFSSNISKIITLSFAQRHLQILIHYLLKAGSNIINRNLKTTINFLNFSTKNILKSQIICNEKITIKILNFLSEYSNQNFDVEKVQISTLRNKQSINLSCIFFKKFKAIYQFMPEKSNNKQRRADYMFSKFIWKMRNNHFGVIAQASLTFCRNDSLTYKLFKKQDQDSKTTSKKIGQKDLAFFTKCFKKNNNIFICRQCNKIRLNEAVNNDYIFCTICILKYHQSLKNKQNVIINFFKKSCKPITSIQQFRDDDIIFVHHTKNQLIRLQIPLQIYKVKQFKGLPSLLLFPMNSLRSNQQQFEPEYFQLNHLYRTWQKGELLYCTPQYQLQLLNDSISKYTQFSYIEQETTSKILSIQQVLKRNIYLSQLNILDLSDNIQKFDDWLKQMRGNKQLRVKKSIKIPKEVILSKLDLAVDPFIQIAKLQNVDLSMLTTLNLSENKLRSINLNHFMSLVDVDISHNQITSLDIKYLCNLQTLNACQNNIYAIIFPHKKKPAQHNESPHQNPLEIDQKPPNKMDSSASNKIGFPTKIKMLNLSYNKLNQIIIPQCSIEELDISNNYLKKMDISKAINLIYLDLSFNNLTAISLTENTNLQVLHLENNQLTQINISYNLKLRDIFIEQNRFTQTILLGNHKYLQRAYFAKNLLPNMLSGQLLYLKQLSLSESKIKEITVNYQNLAFLQLTHGELQQIIFRKSPKLQILMLQSNKLTRIDLSNCPLLKLIDINSNKVASLDLSVNQLLQDIIVGYNRLQQLILPKNDRLKLLNCRKNRLKEITLYVNTGLLIENIFLDLNTKEKNKRVSEAMNKLKNNKGGQQHYSAITLQLQSQNEMILSIQNQIGQKNHPGQKASNPSLKSEPSASMSDLK